MKGFTDKKENKIFLINKEIQRRSGARPYMRKGFLIYEEMRKFFPIYEQWWANLDQASKDLDKTIFRDLSPTPIP
jgi:hypothetical protein